MKIKYKRLAAYIIDSLLVSLIVSLFVSSSLMKSTMDKYDDARERFNNYYNEMLDNVNSDDFDIDQNELKKVVYEVNYYSVSYNALQVTCLVLYYVVFQFYNKGQTIGKKLLKLKVVNINNEELSLSNMLLRNVLLYNVIFTILNMFLVQFASLNVFIIGSLIINSIQSIITIVIMFMILFRNDERGLHDLLGSSKVIEVNKGV